MCKRGLRWLETAAGNGSRYAAYRLGKEYLRGKIVEKDVAIAVDYLTQSAEAGSQYAQYVLFGIGIFYHQNTTKL